MFPHMVKVGVILFIWESVHAVLGAKFGCSRQPEPHVWIQREDRCYLVQNDYKREYYLGKENCQELCSDYVTPNSQEENDWILNKFQAHYPKKNKLWIGCNNIMGEWACLGERADKYRNWKDGEDLAIPNRSAYMDNKFGGTWVLAKQFKAKWAMCEAPAQPPISPLKVRCNAVAIPNGKCPKPVVTFNGTTPMQCCLMCAKQCNCRSFSLTPGTQDCNTNLDKISDPNPTLIDQTCEYYEYEIQD